jgi:hypothetical protein
VDAELLCLLLLKRVRMPNTLGLLAKIELGVLSSSHDCAERSRKINLISFDLNKKIFDLIKKTTFVLRAT